MALGGAPRRLLSVLAGVLAAGALTGAASAQANVLLVCPARARGARLPGRARASIQDAVNAASPGDWVPDRLRGDYHEKGTYNTGVRVTTPGIHIRGMDRNRVVVDGTKASSSTPTP